MKRGDDCAARSRSARSAPPGVRTRAQDCAATRPAAETPRSARWRQCPPRRLCRGWPSPHCRTRPGNRSPRSPSRRRAAGPGHRTAHQPNISAMPAKRQLHEQSVIHSRAQHQWHGHQVEQVPGPAAQGHGCEQAQPAHQQHRHAQQHLRQATKRQPERGQHQQDHGQDQQP